MIDIVQTDACVLCRACSTACPVGAITFTKEHGRFLYPEIRQDICVHCERCARVCPALNQPVIREASPKGFVAMSQDQENRGRRVHQGAYSMSLPGAHWPLAGMSAVLSLQTISRYTM